MAAVITIPAANINTTEYKELVKDLLEELVANDTSPFKTAQDSVDAYLDSADLDSTQKATIYSDFMMKAYTQVNQQAMNTAMDLLKTNEELALKRYEVEASVNVQNETKDKITADISKTSKEELVAEATRELTVAKVATEEMVGLEMVAKLRKHYGYSANISTTLDATTTAALTAFRTSLADELALLVSPADDTQITILTEQIAALDDQLSRNVSTLGIDNGNGSIDKQIVGYDKVNYKDALKTINEQIALTTNAGVAPAAWQMNAGKILIEMITDGKLDIAGSTNTYTQDWLDEDPVNNIIPEGFVIGDLMIDNITTVAYVSTNTEANGLS